MAVFTAVLLIVVVVVSYASCFPIGAGGEIHIQAPRPDTPDKVVSLDSRPPRPGINSEEVSRLAFWTALRLDI